MVAQPGNGAAIEDGSIGLFCGLSLKGLGGGNGAPARDPEKTEKTGTIPSPVWGAQVAVESLLEAFVQNGTTQRYSIFSPPQTKRKLEGNIAREAERRPSARRVSVHSLNDIINGRFATYPFRAWFNAGLTFAELSDLRRGFSTCMYPVTVVHHTISYRNLLHGAILPTLLGKSYAFDSIICTSQASRSAMEKLLNHVTQRFEEEYGVRLRYRGRLDVIPFGTDLERFRPRDKPTVRRQLGLDPDSLLVLYVGRVSITTKMDLLPLLQVFKTILEKKRPKKVELLIVGAVKGSDLNALIESTATLGLGGHVRVSLPTPERELLFSAADIFVSPCDNIQETFGLTNIEAMASGLPQVVSDWDGYRDTVRHGLTGFRVPTYWGRCDSDVSLASPVSLSVGYADHGALGESTIVDLKLLKQYLERLIDDESLRLSMSCASRELAKREYGWDKVISTYEHLWDDLAGQARTTRIEEQPTTGYASRYSTPSFYATFGHYATRSLEDDMQLALTPHGADASGRDMVLPPTHPARALDLLSDQLLGEILDHVASRQRSGAPECEIGDVVERLTRAHPTTTDSIRRHIHWLLKYGLLDVHQMGRSLGSDAAFVSDDDKGARFFERLAR